MAEQQTLPTLQALWRELVAIFPPSLHAAYLLKAFTGFSARARIDHVSDLVASSAYKRGQQATKELSASTLDALHKMAEINFEQVSDALRLFIIVNVTVPMALLLFMVEVLDINLLNFMDRLFDHHEIILAFSIGSASLAIVAFVGHHYAAMLSARNLRDFLRLQRAERSASIETAKTS